VASNKRQRKKSNQAARRAALEAARKRQQRKRQILNFGGLALGVVLLAALIAFISSSGDDGDDAAPTTTTAPGTAAGVPPPPPGREIKGDTPCPKPTGEERASKFEKPPPMCIDPAKKYQAVFTTSAGVVKAGLDTQRTPQTTNNFVVLARYGYYNGTSFHRTEPGIDIIQGGSPHTNTAADPGPGYTIQDEGGKFTYAEGDLVMARTGAPNSASAQYFFSAGPKTASLGSQGTYVTFGKVAEGLDVLKKVLATHAPCGPGSPPDCNGGTPQPPVTVEGVTIEEA
jgi:cyclophilin family peptidyl-prolyl cis-trans isomerase